MTQYIGLDVSLKDTLISMREGGRRVWRGRCPSDPQALAEVIRKRAPAVSRIVFETGPLSTWYYHELTAAGLPAVCIDARQAKKGLDMARNKTTPMTPTASRIWPKQPSTRRSGSRAMTNCSCARWSRRGPSC